MGCGNFGRTCALAIALATPAWSGNLAYEAPAEPPVVIAEQPGSMAGSGAWLIPLIAIGLVGLAVSQGDDPPKDDEPEEPEEPCVSVSDGGTA